MKGLEYLHFYRVVHGDIKPGAPRRWGDAGWEAAGGTALCVLSLC